MYPSQPARRARGAVDRRVDPVVAHEVATSYLDAPSRRDPLTAAAYAQLVTESDRLFRWIASPDQADPVRVVFTACPTPYRDAQALIDSVTIDRRLEVTTAAPDGDRSHPMMDTEPGGALRPFPRGPRHPGSRSTAAGLRSGQRVRGLAEPGPVPRSVGAAGARHRTARPAQCAVDDRRVRRTESGAPRSALLRRSRGRGRASRRRLTPSGRTLPVAALR